RLSQGYIRIVLVSGFRRVGGIPVVAVDAGGQCLHESRCQTRRIRTVRISMDIEHIEGTSARDLIPPIDFIEPPGQEIHSAVCAPVVAICTIPVEPPTAADRAEANRRRIPHFETA